ncbi:MAG: hypothetical protein WBJ88_02035, partial [Candidatus Methanoculleus thermohydrogenotrophicum]
MVTTIRLRPETKSRLDDIKTHPPRLGQNGTKVLYRIKDNHIVNNLRSENSAVLFMVQKDGFKPYHQGQTFLLPLSLEEFVPPNHSARIISAVVDKL